MILPFFVMAINRIRRARKFISNFKNSLDRDKILFEIWSMPESQDLIVELNHEQLRNGLDAFGQLFGRYASSEYARFKASRASYKAPFGTVDLFLNGDYFDTFRVTPTNRGFILQANNKIHGDDFEVKYNAKIVGLTDESKKILIQEIRPFFREEVVRRRKKSRVLR